MHSVEHLECVVMQLSLARRGLSQVHLPSHLGHALAPCTRRTHLACCTWSPTSCCMLLLCCVLRTPKCWPAGAAAHLGSPAWLPTLLLAASAHQGQGARRCPLMLARASRAPAPLLLVPKGLCFSAQPATALRSSKPPKGCLLPCTKSLHENRQRKNKRKPQEIGN